MFSHFICLWQKLADSTTSGSSSVQPKQDNKVNSSSLIDFDAMPEPTSNATEPQANVTASKTNNESSSVESSVTQVATNAPNMNSLESLLLDWSDSKASPSAGAGGPQPSTLKADDVGITKAPDLSDSIGALAITTTENEQNQTNQVRRILMSSQLTYLKFRKSVLGLRIVILVLWKN